VATAYFSQWLAGNIKSQSDHERGYTPFPKIGCQALKELERVG
jgi:hypothetical protein